MISGFARSFIPDEHLQTLIGDRMKIADKTVLQRWADQLSRRASYLLQHNPVSLCALRSIALRLAIGAGDNRCIGRALVEEVLRRGAKRVYATMRQPLTYSDGRVTSLTLDVTNAAQIQEAVEKVDSLDILVNNA